MRHITFASSALFGSSDRVAKGRVRSLLAVGLLAAAVSVSPAFALEVKAVELFDLAKYLGTWHEIAAIPQFFQRKCVRDTKASYSAGEEGLIRVDNVCTRDNGARERAIGRARASEASVASKLEVTFLDLFGEYQIGRAHV